MHLRRFTGLALAVTLLVPFALAEEDLFAEAGHSRAHSRWIVVRYLPLIQIALEADDVVLMESIDHPAQGLALRIDDDAVAADCAVTDHKDVSTTYRSERVEGNGSGATVSGSQSTVTTTTYSLSCQFPEGTTQRVVGAHSVTVQVALPNGTTDPKTLSSKQVRRFQTLDR